MRTIFKSPLFYTLEEQRENEKDIKQMALEDGIELTEEEASDRFYEDAWREYDYVKEELTCADKTNYSKILAFGTVGTWRGSFSGYKILDSIQDIMNCCECDDLHIYTEHNNVKGVFTHHDGRHYMTFRKIRNMDNIDNLLDKIYNNEYVSSGMINYYTESLYPTIKEIYS